MFLRKKTAPALSLLAMTVFSERLVLDKIVSFLLKAFELIVFSIEPHNKGIHI
jgi:hypothetical protein